MSRRNRNRTTRTSPEPSSREKFIAAMTKYLPALSAIFVIAFSGGLMYPVTLGFVGLVPFAYGLYVSADKLYLKLQSKFEATAFAAANPKWKNTLFKSFMAISTLVVIGTLASMVYFAGPLLVGALLPLVSHAAVAWIASTQIFLAAAMLFSTLSFAVSNALCTDSIFSKLFKPSPYKQLKELNTEPNHQAELNSRTRPKSVLQANVPASDHQLSASKQHIVRPKLMAKEQTPNHDQLSQVNNLALPKNRALSKEVPLSKSIANKALNKPIEKSHESKKHIIREDNKYGVVKRSSNTRNLKPRNTKPKTKPNI